MDKNLEKLSALYDSEVSLNEMQEILKDMDEGEDSVTKRSKAYHATSRS